MAELSEKELLLLSNYMYLQNATNKVTINDMLQSMQDANGFIDPSKLPQASGGMTGQEIEVLFQEMNCASDEFRSLTVTEIVNEDGLRAACFENSVGEGTVIFRGTGGEYQAWADNMLGGTQTDTPIQKRAAEFIQKDCARYHNLTVAGHSKGGNLAQYVTVKCNDQIDRCISYDGQGQNTHFIRSNLADVRTAQKKIKSISAHNDFVNILLTSIAGRRVFVRNQGTGIDAHKSIRLLTDNEFDPETGAFISTCEQDPDMKMLQGFLANGVIRLDELPYGINEGVYQSLASILAGVMSSDRSLKYKMTNSAYQLARLQQTIETPESEGFEVNLNAMSFAQTELDAVEKSMSEVQETIEGMDGALCNALSNKLHTEYQKLQRIHQATETIWKQYYEGEKMVIIYCSG